MEHLRFRGKVWAFGNNIDTDQIIPGKHAHLPVEEVSKHIFEPVDRGFARQFQAGQIIVAGSNFGCGSNGEVTPGILKRVGVAAVVAESFGRVFFRTAIAIGLPVLVCSGVSAEARKGDEIEVELDTGRVTNLSSDRGLEGVRLGEMMLASVSKGGIMNLLLDD